MWWEEDSPCLISNLSSSWKYGKGFQICDEFGNLSWYAIGPILSKAHSTTDSENCLLDWTPNGTGPLNTKWIVKGFSEPFILLLLPLVSCNSQPQAEPNTSPKHWSCTWIGAIRSSQASWLILSIDLQTKISWQSKLRFVICLRLRLLPTRSTHQVRLI